MICVSFEYASDWFDDGLRAPPRTGWPSPAATANGVTSRATAIAAITIQGPFPRNGRRLRMLESIGGGPPWSVERQAARAPGAGGARPSCHCPLQQAFAREGCGPARRLSEHGEQRPAAGDVAQVVRPAILEADPRADDRAVDGPGDEQLAGLGQLRDARGDVDRHAADVVAEHLALARVQPDPDRQPERLEALHDRLGAAHRVRRRARERDEERIADRLDLAEQRGAVADARQVVDALELDVARAGDVLGDVARVAHVDQAVAHAVEDQGRHAEVGELGADVEVRGAARRPAQLARARRQALQPREPGPQPRVPGPARGDLVEHGARAPAL